MKVEVKRHEIDLAKYGWYVKDYVLKFLKDNHVLNSENANNLQGIKIYAENLVEQNVGRMVSRPGKNPPEIAIDFQFFNLETMTLKKQNQKVIFFLFGAQLHHKPFLHPCGIHNRTCRQVFIMFDKKCKSYNKINRILKIVNV